MPAAGQRRPQRRLGPLHPGQPGRGDADPVRDPAGQAGRRRLVPGGQAHRPGRGADLRLGQPGVAQRGDRAALGRRADAGPEAGAPRRPRWCRWRRAPGRAGRPAGPARRAARPCRRSSGRRRWPGSRRGPSRRCAASRAGRRARPAKSPGRGQLGRRQRRGHRGRRDHRGRRRAPDTARASRNAESAPPENATSTDPSAASSDPAPPTPRLQRTNPAPPRREQGPCHPERGLGVLVGRRCPPGRGARTDSSRISTLRTLPVTVIGNSSTTRTYRGIL